MKNIGIGRTYQRRSQRKHQEAGVIRYIWKTGEGQVLPGLENHQKRYCSLGVMEGPWEGILKGRLSHDLIYILIRSQKCRKKGAKPVINILTKYAFRFHNYFAILEVGSIAVLEYLNIVLEMPWWSPAPRWASPWPHSSFLCCFTFHGNFLLLLENLDPLEIYLSLRHLSECILNYAGLSLKELCSDCKEYMISPLPLPSE